MTTSKDIAPFIDEQVNRALARLNFWEFCLYWDPEFFAKRPFLKQVADGFQQIADGQIHRMAVSMPPRAGKSYITSLFCAWWLGKHPERSIMRNTCTARLYNKFSYDVRSIVREPKFNNVFPSVQLAPDKQNVEGWNLTTSKQVGYFGAGVGGTIIGFGANMAITDDLYKDMEDALSETVQDSTAMWKQSAHDSRKEKDCPEIFIGTRWTKNDEIGKAIEKGDLDLEIKISALTEEGETFCDDVKSTEEYLKIKSDIDESIWDAEYMQEPAELKGLLFPPSSLKYFAPSEIEGLQPEFKYMYVDNSDTGDFTAAPICYLYQDRVYIVDVVFNNHGTDITIPTIVEEICTRKMDAVELEGNSAWVLYGKEVRNKVEERQNEAEIRIIKNTTNKETRIKSRAPFAKNHFFFLKEEYRGKEYKDFMRNLTRYLREGSNKHDDAPDAIAGAVSYFKTQFSHLW